MPFKPEKMVIANNTLFLEHLKKVIQIYSFIREKKLSINSISYYIGFILDCFRLIKKNQLRHSIHFHLLEEKKTLVSVYK